MIQRLNSQQKLTLKLVLLAVGLIIILAIPGFLIMQSSNQQMAKRQRSMLSPVIMIPGSSATKERFNRLVNLLNKDTNQKHSLLKVEVFNNGKITYSGKINRGDREPFIVVGFQNNHDGYSNIKQQAKMFNQAFEQLSEEYQFNNFKAFGHSNGGLIWTQWLENYYQDYRDSITIKSLMTVASPFNFEETSTRNKTQMFTDFVKYRDQIPSSLNVIAVVGNEDSYTSDGLVPANSVLAGKYIYQKRVKNYTSMTVTGEQAQHSNLPQNQQIVKLIEQYLLDSTKQRRQPEARTTGQN
ncbi:alpha/beta hydrolase [Lactobacillus sp. 3B(2020)]|uniref:alpha/beta hydrolase n=1 Tax=Lactobacillus sp. 3B(2020) TaxID=2695882 RepID=UPI0015DE6470|nr:alpha/beta hydrolase [Lactobacillus sp. 3B(2020)]QLL69948.1 alpha/beta hydrolase [Lactobacillus sp. 3B(2020)]